MNINGFSTVRSTDNARATLATSQIQRTQAAIGRTQQELATGKKLLRPSDDPGDAVVAQQLQKTLEDRQAYAGTLQSGQRLLGDVDEALGQASELLREAQTTAQANLSTGTSPEEQKGAAVALREIQRRLVDLANTRSNGVPLFGGDRDRDPYVAGTNGVTFVGSQTALGNRVSERAETDILLTGGSVFGGLSGRVGDADLAPRLSAATRLSDLGGARGEGVRGNVIRINNNGVTADVDLADADTIGDVIGRINASGIGVAASVSAGGDSLQVAGTNVAINEAGGTAAADLGLLQPVAAATVSGADVRPKLGDFTPLADLRNGAGLDLAGGLTVTNGDESQTIDLAGVTTVGELLGRLNNAGVSLRASISDDGESLVLQNPTQGGELRVKEGTGTTAADLGWLTFTANDVLGELNGGRGVRVNPEGPDLTLTDGGGVQFDVDLDAANTMQDVADAINAAATSAGAATTAAFDPDAPGLVLTNVQHAGSVGESRAAFDLGLDAAVSPAGTLVGRDVNPVTVGGVFGHLRTLIAALDRGDVATATTATGDLGGDEDLAISKRAEAGARLQNFDARLTRLEDQNVATKEVLSRLEDADYAETVTRFQSLQNSLQASLQTTSQVFGLTLFDFLR